MIRGGKLVLRIYLIGLAQIAALAVTFALAREASEPPVTRQKLGDDPRNPHLLKTIRGVGYMLASA